MVSAAATTTTSTPTSTSTTMSTNEQQQLQRKQTVLQKSERAAKDMSRRMVCGGLAGCIAKTATNPLERIKMLSQTGEHGLKTDSVMGLYRSIIQNEGVIGLWAGNGANLLRIFPAKAVVFASNDMYQGIFRQLTHTPEHQKLHSAYAFFAGGLAGMSATACTYPLDFARGRISGKLASHARKKEYKGIWTTILLTVRDEGALALYKGVTPTLLGALPYEGIKFGTVGVLEKLFPLPVDVPVDQQQPQTSAAQPLRKMIFGGIGGVMAGLITYPNDTVRRLLQLQGSRGTNVQYAGYFDCVKKTYQAEGIGRFYRGILINIIRMAPNAAVQFGSYELLKQLTAKYF